MDSVFIGVLHFELNQRLFDQLQQEWWSNIENSSKGLCYQTFKDNFEFESYLVIFHRYP